MKPRYHIDLEDGILLVNPYKTDRSGPYVPVTVLDPKIIEQIKMIVAEVNNERKIPTHY